MTIHTKFWTECDGCSNITFGTWRSRQQMDDDLKKAKWLLHVLSHWDYEVRDFCPDCICTHCKNSRGVPDWNNQNYYGEPTPVRCPECE